MYKPLTIESCYSALKVGDVVQGSTGILSALGPIFNSAARDLEKLTLKVEGLSRMSPGHKRENHIRELKVGNVENFRDALKDSFQTEKRDISPLRHSFLMLERTLVTHEQQALIKFYQNHGLNDDAYRLSLLGKLQELLGKETSISLKDPTVSISRQDTGIYTVRVGSADEPSVYYFNPTSNQVKCINFNRKNAGIEKIPCHMLSRVVAGLSKD